MTRFTFDADVDAIRAALIEDDLEDLNEELVELVITTYPDEFRELARRYITRSWANNWDVWEEAHDRGYFTGEE